MQNNEEKTTKTTAIETFSFSGNQIRVVINENNEPLFLAIDICHALDLNNVGQAISKLDDDEKHDIILNDVAGRPNRFIALDESGLYSLILSSRKNVAKTFKKWVTKEVLPSIRKTGKYELPAKNQEAEREKYFIDEDGNYKTTATEDEIAERLITESESVRSLLSVINNCIDSKLMDFERFKLRTLENKLMLRMEGLEKNVIETLHYYLKQLGKQDILTTKMPQKTYYYVYLIHKLGTDEYKIGKSNDPEYRAYRLALGAGSDELVVECRLCFAEDVTALAWEKALKLFFKTQEIGREWYKLEAHQVAFFHSLSELITVVDVA